MTRKELREKLAIELAAWEAKPYEEVERLDYPVVYVCGTKGEEEFYSTEVLMLEKSKAWVHLSIAVDDGGISAFAPVSGSLIISSK